MISVELRTTQLREMPDQDNVRKLRKNTQNAVRNFFSSPVNDELPSHMHSDEEISEVTERVWEPIERNNKISEIFNSEEFKSLKERKLNLRGPAEIGVTWCIDGRNDSMSMGTVVDIWENPAGVIDVEETRDGLLRPKSTELCMHIKDDAENGRELLELVFAHFDSTDPKLGCAANAETLELVRRNITPENHGKLTFDELSEISHVNPEHAENANLIILRGTTVAAFNDYYNKIRRGAGYSELKKLAIAALYDTATMGIILRENGHEDLSTARLANEFREAIQNATGEKFGQFKDTFTDPDRLIELTEKVVGITEFLLKPNSEISTFYEFIENHISSIYPDMTSNQAQALRFLIAKTVAFQHLTGLSEIPTSGPDHPFSKHDEGYMGVSVRGEFIGKYDTKQAFGSSAADAQTAIKQLITKWGVMDKAKRDTGKPRIMYVCNSISKEAFLTDKRARKRAAANNASITSEIIHDPTINGMVRRNRLVVVNALIDDATGEVLDILDHSDLM